MKLRKHYRGCYRFDLNDFAFGQVTKQLTWDWSGARDNSDTTSWTTGARGQWFAEIRQCRTGDLIKACWLWNTRREAVEEILAGNPLDYLDHSIGR